MSLTSSSDWRWEVKKNEVNLHSSNLFWFWLQLQQVRVQWCEKEVYSVWRPKKCQYFKFFFEPFAHWWSEWGVVEEGIFFCSSEFHLCVRSLTSAHHGIQSHRKKASWNIKTILTLKHVNRHFRFNLWYFHGYFFLPDPWSLNRQSHKIGKTEITRQISWI